MGTPRVDISGTTLMARVPINWPLKYGVRPATTTVEVDVEEAFEILNSSSPITLRWEDEAGTVMEVSNLFVMQRSESAGDRDIEIIILADRRAWWDRHGISKAYNMSRTTGDRRFLGADADEPMVFDPIEDEIRFKPYSIKDKDTRFSVDDMFKDIVKEVVRKDQEFISSLPGLRFEAVFSKDYPLENVEFMEDGASALLKAMNKIPGAAIYVDLNGEVVVVDRLSGRERLAFRNAGSPLGDKPSFETRISYRNQRPNNVNVYLEAKHDLAFFAEEIETVEAGGTTATLPNDESRYMDNVLAIPDPTLTVVDERTGESKLLAAGSWITFSEALNAWNAEGSGPRMTMEDIRQNILWNVGWFEWVGIGPAQATSARQIWQRRVNAIMTHWRRSYRINSKWRDNLKSLEATQVSLRSTRGTRAPAVAYANVFTRVNELQPTNAVVVSDREDGFNFDANINTLNDGKPGNKGAIPWESAVVTVTDSDAGIIRVDWQSTPNDPVNQILPGTVENAVMINHSLQDTRFMAYDQAKLDGDATKLPQMSANFKMVVIVSGTAASPNSLERFHKETIKLGEIADILDGMQRNAKGPDWDIIIGAGVLTADFAWSDDFAESIQEAFGIPEPPDERPLLDELLVNGVEGGIRGKGFLHDFALAVAATTVALMSFSSDNKKPGYFAKTSVRISRVAATIRVSPCSIT